MVIRELIRRAALDKTDAAVLLCHVLGIAREALLFHYDAPVSDADAASFFRLAEKRRAGCPVSYLTGEKEFYSLPFFVTPDTLIPRPDTETLVDWAIPLADGKRILDLCCGSGCIGIAVAKNASPASVAFADISAGALAVAQKNARRHGVEASFYPLDILSDALPGTYDLILANPPYIRTAVIETLSADVRDYEPRKALDGGADGLSFYPVIIRKALAALTPGGALGLEIGYDEGSAVLGMMQPFYREARILRDLGGNDRCCIGIKG